MRARSWCLVLLVSASCGSKGTASKGGEVVAQVGGRTITAGEVEEQLARQPSFARTQLVDTTKKREYVERMLHFEILAEEAQRRGFDKDPDVVRTMKQQMVGALMRKDLEEKFKVQDVPAAEVEKYYRDHQAEFVRPDEVRISQIFTRDRGKADKALAEAKKLPSGDAGAFRDLVMKVSEDDEAKGRGGDSGFFAPSTPTLPKPLVEAAFKVPSVGTLTGPVQTEKGFYVFRLTQKRPGFTRSLLEATPQIQAMLYQKLRSDRMEAMVKELGDKLGAKVFEDRLAAIDFGRGAAQPTASASK